MWHYHIESRRDKRKKEPISSINWNEKFISNKIIQKGAHAYPTLTQIVWTQSNKRLAKTYMHRKYGESFSFHRNIHSLLSKSRTIVFGGESTQWVPLSQWFHILNWRLFLLQPQRWTMRHNNFFSDLMCRITYWCTHESGWNSVYASVWWRCWVGSTYTYSIQSEKLLSWIYLTFFLHSAKKWKFQKTNELFTITYN